MIITNILIKLYRKNDELNSQQSPFELENFQTNFLEFTNTAWILDDTLKTTYNWLTHPTNTRT